MNKKIIIDLDGVIFEPVAEKFSDAAIAKYGAIKGRAVSVAYHYNIGRRIFAKDIADVWRACATQPTVRPGALEVLDAISQMPGVTIEFCSQIAFPGQESELEQQYRALGMAMDSAAHYELMSPFASKRQYLRNRTKADESAMNYIVDTKPKNLDWPTRWRIIPVLVQNNNGGRAAVGNTCNARVFGNLSDFRDFLAHRCR